MDTNKLGIKKIKNNYIKSFYDLIHGCVEIKQNNYTFIIKDGITLIMYNKKEIYYTPDYFSKLLNGLDGVHEYITYVLPSYLGLHDTHSIEIYTAKEIVIGQLDMVEEWIIKR